ncbi:MAG: hypothetical protein HUJ31_13750 [Pseudomonadales bacterium]|nr:hypothetical protein [Pseudomonadales bacterium]
MKLKTSRKALNVAIGTAMVAGLAASPVTLADSNPFGATELSGGDRQMAAKADAEGKCGEAKCGADASKASSEGSCGADKAGGEGSCGADADKAAAEGSCGGKAEAEGNCGAAKEQAKAGAEGKCGEGKCGS